MKMRKMRLTVALILLLSLLLPVLAGCSDDRADRKKEAEMLRLWEDTVVNGNGVGSIEFSKTKTQPSYSCTSPTWEKIMVDSADDVHSILSVLSNRNVAFSTHERVEREREKKKKNNYTEEDVNLAFLSQQYLIYNLTLNDTDGHEIFTVSIGETGWMKTYVIKTLELRYYINYGQSNETVFADVSDLYDRLNNQTTPEN